MCCGLTRRVSFEMGIGYLNSGNAPRVEGGRRQQGLAGQGHAPSSRALVSSRGPGWLLCSPPPQSPRAPSLLPHVCAPFPYPPPPFPLRCRAHPGAAPTMPRGGPVALTSIRTSMTALGGVCPAPQPRGGRMCEVRLRLTSPVRGRPWALEALFGPGRLAQSPKPCRIAAEEGEGGRGAEVGGGAAEGGAGGAEGGGGEGQWKRGQEGRFVNRLARVL